MAMTNSATMDRNNSIKSSFSWRPAVAAFISLECLVAIQGFSAYRDGIFTVPQMREKGIDQGLPFVWHFGMWGDILVVSALVSYLIGRYCASWPVRWILLSLVIGLTSAGILSWLYTFSGTPEAHVQNHQLTGAGVFHLIYMAIVITVFVQFLFFTKNISVQLLRVTCVLLSAHVFFGTHMALGILSAIYPLDWYPDQPLKSAFGWITVAVVALGLTSRSVGRVAIISIFWSLSRHLIQAVKSLFDFLVFCWEGVLDNVKSAAGYLRLLNLLCGFVGFGWFVNVIRYRLQVSESLKDGDWASFASSGEGLSLLLVLVFWAKYSFSRQSAKRELEIGKMLFPKGRIPDDWQVKDRIIVTLQVVAFLALYMVLAWSTNDIRLSAVFMFVIAAFDLHGRYLINKNMKRYFSDSRYAPRPEEPDSEVIEGRREVVRWYLFQLPYLWKEAGCMAGCGIAASLAIVGYLESADRLYGFAYVVLIVTLVLNEIITQGWRYQRERRLKAIG